MKTFKLFFFSLLVMTTAGFAENLVLDNQTSYPNNNPTSKTVIQWATSGQDVQEGNNALMYGSKLNPSTLQPLTQAGTAHLTIPANAEYFRILVWSKEGDEPDLVTNWVEVVPAKTYTLKADHLVPTVLMLGSGC